MKNVETSYLMPIFLSAAKVLLIVVSEIQIFEMKIFPGIEKICYLIIVKQGCQMGMPAHSDSK